MSKNKPEPMDTGQSFSKSENNAAKLALIGSAVTTFGDLITTIAAVIALEEIAASEILDQENQRIQDEKMSNMQKQIDYLTSQINQLSKK
ncbi:hypothetical protein [Paenibacillus radicis (ex Gao et al. 2016)]|uniref:Translation initiation factor 2 n=1 Tax=Paenibacillus radicis (ex Gao et al. 2016) TaxID=1737354 RepID=A0A917LWR5_9BACL|nr:hypothetical protein [Paenibacillus radicis (ex Gao et al. 2016)]GGG62483.1 hypothetical protein GCM10010918_15270 [Paenibacillus radicis (ex Gao et al. 2016)]